MRKYLCLSIISLAMYLSTFKCDVEGGSQDLIEGDESYHFLGSGMIAIMSPILTPKINHIPVLHTETNTE